MEKDVLVILMVAFGLFAIIMFILFFVYLKRYYNNRKIDEDYKRDVDDKIYEEMNEMQEEETEFESDMDFVPIKKK